MTQSIPEMPTNVQTTNMYDGLDRGTFLIQSEGGQKVVRVHAVRWKSKGPAVAVGIIEYQLMQYEGVPSTQEDYAAGMLLQAPDGGDWFDGLSRNVVFDPIVAEYWAVQNYMTNYVSGSGERLTQQEIDVTSTQAQQFTQTMGQAAGVSTVELLVEFEAIDGNVLTRNDLQLDVSYVKDGETRTLTLTTEDLQVVPFDPVLVAINAINNL